MHTQSEKDRELGTKSIGKLLFSLAVPAITAQIINVLYNVVDRMYIGHIEGIGPQALTGVGVTMPLITAISAFAMLASMGGAPRASILLGRGDREGAQKVLGNCTLLLIFLSVTLTVLLLLFNRPILMLFGASENTIGYALEYMNIYTLGTIFVQTALGLNAFITAQGFARTHRRGVQHYSGPDLHLRLSHGGTRRGPGHDHLTGDLLRLGGALPLLTKERAAPAAEEHAP